jgi:hypothetical protein
MMKRFACLLALALPAALAPSCTSATTTTKGQLIECDVDANGNTSNCHPADGDDPAPGTCHDVDEDGDDDPADTEEDGDDGDPSHEFTGHPGDGDDDGTPDSEDDDDDNDGVGDGDDCDELPGHEGHDEGGPHPEGP